MSFSNEKGITIQTEAELAPYLLVGVSGGNWVVSNGGDVTPLGVTTHQSTGAGVNGKWNTAVQFLGSGDAVKQLTLAPSQSAVLGSVLYAAADGAVATTGTIAVGRAVEAKSTSTCAAPIAVETTSTLVIAGDGVNSGDFDARTLGDVFVIDKNAEKTNGKYVVPDGTSLINIEWDDLSANIDIKMPADAPSVIAVVDSDDNNNGYTVTIWNDTDSAVLSDCPVRVLVRCGVAGWAELQMNRNIERRMSRRMSNGTFVYDGTADVEPKTITVPAGTGHVACEKLAENVTLSFTGDFYPQVVLVTNASDSTGSVAFAGETIARRVRSASRTSSRAADAWRALRSHGITRSIGNRAKSNRRRKHFSK